MTRIPSPFYERTLELAAIVERQPHVRPDAPEGFSMAAYRHPCNTPSCIAGFALAEAGGEAHDDWDVEKAAMQWLGLTHMQKVALFLAVNHDQQQIKPSEAARCLRHYAETGQVNWDLALGVKL